MDNNQYLQYNITDLQPGWSFTQRLRDVSDIEWSSWKYFIQTSWSYLIVQFIVSEIIRKKSVAHLKHWYITSSVVYILLHMGYRQLIIIAAQPLLYSTILLCGGKKLSIWIASFVLLVGYNSFKYTYYFWYFLDHENLYDEEVYLLLFCVAWILLRCISFCIDYVDNENSSNNNPSRIETIVNMLSYILYVPLLYTGPVILYEEFEKSFCVNHKRLSIRIRRFIWDMLLFVFYTLILDVALHYIYFYAMQNDMEVQIFHSINHNYLSCNYEKLLVILFISRL